MLGKRFPIPLHTQMAGLASAVILAGGMAFGILGWKLLGVLALVFAVQLLFLAYHFAVAPKLGQGTVSPEPVEQLFSTAPNATKPGQPAIR